MEKFIYTAVDKNGKEVKSQIEAVSLNEALGKIRQMGLYPADVVSADEQSKSRKNNILSFLSSKLRLLNSGAQKVRAHDLVIFTRQISVLLDAGLPLVRTLHTLKRQVRFAKMSVLITNIVDRIESGKTFSEALAYYPEIFSKVYINIVKAGETSGALDQILKRLADYLEKNLKLTQRIKSALIYPSLVLIISIGILGFIVVFIIPRFMELFEDTGIALPLLTLTLLKICNFFLMHWYIFLGIIVSIIILYRVFLRNYSFRCFNDQLMLNLPIFGALIQKITAARFARTFSTLLTGGVPILRALELTREVCGNEIIAKAVDSVYESVREGGFISKVLENKEVFPQLMINMIAVGEESGALHKMLSKVADTYEEEVELTANTLTSLLEPVLVIIMGIIVGIIVLSMFLPLVSLIESLTR